MAIPNLGSMGMGAGQDPIQAAMAARAEGGQPVPALQQRMGGQNVPAPVGANPPVGIPAGMNESSGTGKSPTSESELIIKALGQRLSAISAVEKAGSEPKQGAPAFAAQDSAVAMGGGYSKYDM